MLLLEVQSHLVSSHLKRARERRPLLTMIIIACLVWYLNSIQIWHYLIYQTALVHMNTGLVQCSDPHCTCDPLLSQTLNL